MIADTNMRDSGTDYPDSLLKGSGNNLPVFGSGDYNVKTLKYDNWE